MSTPNVLNCRLRRLSCYTSYFLAVNILLNNTKTSNTLNVCERFNISKHCLSSLFMFVENYEIDINTPNCLIFNMSLGHNLKKIGVSFLFVVKEIDVYIVR